MSAILVNYSQEFNYVKAISRTAFSNVSDRGHFTARNILVQSQRSITGHVPSNLTGQDTSSTRNYPLSSREPS